jgi:5-methylcytosine-specific restriction endonuclease McrA
VRECRHAILEPGCIYCIEHNREHGDALRPDLIGPCRHALKEKDCYDCKGLESSHPTFERPVSIRLEIIRAASEEVKEAIKSWRRGWRSLNSVVCYWCKSAFSPDDCHADHVIPLSRGGPHDLNNLVVACASCNLRKHDLMPEVWAEIIAAL